MVIPEFLADGSFPSAMDTEPGLYSNREASNVGVRQARLVAARLPLRGLGGVARDGIDRVGHPIADWDPDDCGARGTFRFFWRRYGDDHAGAKYRRRYHGPESSRRQVWVFAECARFAPGGRGDAG
jgi:hypothetical protein